MSSGAPVCLLPSQGQIPPSQPGRMLPSIPKAQDLPSVIQAINVMTQIINFLTLPSLPPFRNNLAPFTPQGLNVNPIFFAAGNITAQQVKAARFVEVSRQQQKVKVVNPDDDSNFVIVNRINSIVFQDRITGALIVWQR